VAYLTEDIILAAFEARALFAVVIEQSDDDFLVHSGVCEDFLEQLDNIGHIFLAFLRQFPDLYVALDVKGALKRHVLRVSFEIEGLLGHCRLHHIRKSQHYSSCTWQIEQ